MAKRKEKQDKQWYYTKTLQITKDWSLSNTNPTKKMVLWKGEHTILEMFQGIISLKKNIFAMKQLMINSLLKQLNQT
jgi:hypothetical protein